MRIESGFANRHTTYDYQKKRYESQSNWLVNETHEQTQIPASRENSYQRNSGIQSSVSIFYPVNLIKPYQLARSYSDRQTLKGSTTTREKDDGINILLEEHLANRRRDILHRQR
jgi:hypothetical protein